ncbi:MAG: hypothetical protein WCJ61_07555 [Paludibacter sp.]
MNQDIDIIQRVYELKNKIYNPRLQSAFESTICFFENHDKKIVSAAGCGLFLKYKDYYYVVTAAHVLAEYHSDTFVILADKKLVLGGRLVSTPLPDSGKRKVDKIDISILKLCETSTEELLKNFRPIPEDEIELNHKPDQYTTYFSVGFPQTRTGKVWGEDRIKSIGFTYQSVPCSDFDYKKYGFSEKTTIPLKFDGEVINAKNPNPHLAPKLEGVSGSGLWHFFGNDQKSLIGVTIERIYDERNKVLVATKIDIVIGMINKMNK